MDNWLQGFAYRIKPGAEVFLLAGLAAIIISWVTVSYQSIRAAIVNPVKSLRSE
jgi:putative ABC transport system permease protein